MRGFHALLNEARTAEEAALAIASALKASYPAATRARDLCLYCGADTTDARVGGNCCSCGGN